MKINDISSDRQIQVLSDRELLQLHRRLHQLCGAARRRGKAVEYPWTNIHVWVVREMEKRGMKHNTTDELDRETEQLAKYALPAWIADCLREAREAVLVPAYVSLVGSATTDDEPHDLDILIREDEGSLTGGWRESVALLVRHLLNAARPDLKLHLLGNPQGPHLPPGRGYVPLFDLILRPRREAGLITKAASAMPNWRRWLEQAPAGRHVDLGSDADGPPEGFEPLGRPYDLNQTWPLEAGQIAVLRASHVFEHLNEPAHAMTQAWRVLMPGGLLIITVPEATSPGAAAHPEHHSLWNADSFRFWTDPDLLQTVEQRVPQPFELLHLDVRQEQGRRYVDVVLRKPVNASQLQKKARPATARNNLAKVRVRGPIKMMGGKTRLVRKLIGLIPEHRVYVEPYAGGARLFWAKKPAEQEVLNDLDPDIVAVYQFLRDATDAELERFARLDWVGHKATFDRIAESSPKSLLDRAYRTIYLSKFGWWGMQDGKGDFDHHMDGHRIEVNRNWLRRVRERLRGTVIENRDALEVIKEWDSPDTFFYLDPPYLGTEVNYRYGSDPEHLARLGELARTLKGRVIVSGDYETIQALGLPPSWQRKIRTRHELKHCPQYEWIVTNYLVNKDAVGEDISRTAQRTLTPIMRFKPPKPAQKGYAHTDAFSPEEIWPWVEERLEAGVVAEPKYNGFRTILQRRDDRTSLVFEDSLRERWPKLLAADPALARIEELPDCILDCDVGVVEDGRRWSRPKLMALIASNPDLPQGAHIAITAFDLLYWGDEGVSDRPFRDRRALLEQIGPALGKAGVAISPQVVVRTRADLVKAWRSADFGLMDGSEGLVLKALDWVYRPGVATSGMAKIKHVLEIKAIVLETKTNADGSLSLRGGLLPGKEEASLKDLVRFRGRSYVDLGFSYNADFDVRPGDLVTFQVEEIIWNHASGHLDWLGAKPLDVDKSRSTPYAAAQVIDMARRAKVLQEVSPPQAGPASRAGVKTADLTPGSDTTFSFQNDRGDEKGEDASPRSVAALRNWEEHWQEAMPMSGKALPFILHAHWRGLSEKEAELDLPGLLKTGRSLHFDLRLGTDRFGGWWGISLFAGTTEANREQLRIFDMVQDPQVRLESAPKQFGPQPWLKVGLAEPLVVQPGGVGSSSRTWSKFFAIDHGTWRLGMARLHGVEIWLDGQLLKGRFLWQYAPIEEGRPRQWLFTRPEDQRPYASTHDLDEIVQELARKGQRWLFWPKDPDNLSEGLWLVDISKAARQLQKYFVVKEAAEQRYTLGVAYPVDSVDVQGDYTTTEELEKAAWSYLRRIQEGRAGVGLMHHPDLANAGTVVESYIYRGPAWYAEGQVVRPGDWLLGVVWNEEAWELIRCGKVTGYSLQGIAEREPLSLDAPGAGDSC